jgi:hypothetical protein
MLAVASEKPVHVSDTVEASAFCAGWLPTIEAAAEGMAGVRPMRRTRRISTATPRCSTSTATYAANAGINPRLIDFAAVGEGMSRQIVSASSASFYRAASRILAPGRRMAFPSQASPST